ncbi:uncharacterized protein [Amphiura filiformis]|uniref:uncharacterized protein n=1 Tax=Amphiura filiformis TaxID=82378 RepID=UPI003B21787B
MLKLNDSKTEFFVATPSHLKHIVGPVSLCVGDMLINPSDNIRNLGIIFDSSMSFSAYITNLCCSLTYHLRNLSRIRRCLDRDTCHLVIRALILSKIDYGNGLLLGSNKTDIQRIQRIQNWAAKMICQVRKQDHATPCLEELHWLPVEKRIVFKVLLFVYKCLNHIAPNYISSCITLNQPGRAGLRSASDTTRLTEHNTSKLLKSAERGAFYYNAPRMWNRLPINIRESASLAVFKKALKTHLYKSS